MIELYRDRGLTGIVAIESRGFLFAAPLALALGLPLILARKKGKLPGRTLSESYTLEYGSATLEIHAEDLPAGGNLLIIDDLVATGGTLRAVANMIERQGSAVAGVFCVVGLPFLKYQDTIGAIEVTTLIDYHGE
jgi:adenine phosphoribosyltransferase